MPITLGSTISLLTELVDVRLGLDDRRPVTDAILLLHPDDKAIVTIPQSRFLKKIPSKSAYVWFFLVLYLFYIFFIYVPFRVRHRLFDDFTPLAQVTALDC